jgi:hypothetical protein
VYDANPDQSDNTTDVKILTSVDAAAASLQLGTNNEETQAIEISSNDVTTTIYGPVTMLNMLNASSIELTTDLNVSGRTTLMNVSTQALTATSLDVTGDIGSISSTGTIIKGGIIKQVTPFVGGGTCEVVIGNANNATSMSTTFNRKNVATTSPIACYRVVSPSQYNYQYFELVVSAANYGLGGFCYKGCFVISTPGITIVASSVNTLFSIDGTPTISFITVNPTTIDIYINTALPGTTNQAFISTLISYPSATINNDLNDYSITAI